jgi:ABC-2 type transporter
LLKKGGYSVYFGDLGAQSKMLIKYFERQGVTKFEAGDNPANWMLRVLSECSDNPADTYVKTREYATLKKQLALVKVNPPNELEILFSSEYAVSPGERRSMMNQRLQTIYWRSPTYNQSRLLISIFIAFILGSVFLTQRKKQVLTETDLQAYFSVTFLSFIIIGILCIISVLPVMLAIRDVFYRQRSAGMIDNVSLGRALAYAEKGFICVSSFLFCLFYLASSGTMVPEGSTSFFARTVKFWVSTGSAS